MRFDEYRSHDAVGLAALVAKGEVTAGELLDVATARMAQVNPQLNAVTRDLTAEARAQPAGQGPLAGVPYLLKDLGAAYGGVPTTYGSKLFSQTPAAADSAITRLYKAAGLTIFGKTNTPEFGLWPVTESDLLGPARNPWDLSRTPGGSSGGASAAVAGGIVPAAHASDGGGSIRIPASCCGLFGMKPSRGRVSFSPGGEGWAGASIMHAVTRSVRDSAVLLDIACVPQAGDPYFLDTTKTLPNGDTPVWTAMHGTGTWEPILAASSLSQFLQILRVWVRIVVSHHDRQNPDEPLDDAHLRRLTNEINQIDHAATHHWTI